MGVLIPPLFFIYYIMSLLDDEIKVMDSWDPSEQIYKDFIDVYMGGSLIQNKGIDYSMFEYDKYSISREFAIYYADRFDNDNRGKENPYYNYNTGTITYKNTTMWCITPQLHHIYDSITKKKIFTLYSPPGTIIGVNNNGESVSGMHEPLCIMNFKEEELKYYNKPINIVSTNIDDKIILFNCNPKLEIPGFEVERIFI
jgi:hypothetical protein